MITKGDGKVIEGPWGKELDTLPLGEKRTGFLECCLQLGGAARQNKIQRPNITKELTRRGQYLRRNYVTIKIHKSTREYYKKDRFPRIGEQNWYGLLVYWTP